jgi:hypothetical protein
MHKPNSPLEELLMRVAAQKEVMIGISNYNLVNTGQLVSFLEVILSRGMTGSWSGVWVDDKLLTTRSSHGGLVKPSRQVYVWHPFRQRCRQTLRER